MHLKEIIYKLFLSIKKICVDLWFYLFPKIKSIVLKLNEKLLLLTDKIYYFYNKYIAGKFGQLIQFIKNVFKKAIELIKKFFHFVAEFYKKDKKRAIIYFILLYIIYKFVFSFVSRMSLMFVNNKNDIVVSVREVYPERVNKEMSCYGYLESENNLQYLSEVRGNVEKIFVQEKQYVHEGQLLMTLDSKFTVNSYISAKSVLESKKLKFDAVKKLFADGLESKGNLKATEAELENATSNFESEKKSYNGLMVRAPFDGYIDNITLKEGSQINPGSKLFTLERMGAMQVKCEVNNLAKNELDVGDNVKVFIGGHEMAKGDVAVIGDSVDVYTGSRSILVKNIVGLEGFEDKIKNGMSVMLKITAKAQEDSYMISSEALETTQTGAFMVKVLEPKTGLVSSKNVWIYNEENGVDYVSGLENGDYVVERGHEFVAIGEKGIKYSKVDNKNNKPANSVVKNNKDESDNNKKSKVFSVIKEKFVKIKDVCVEFYDNRHEFWEFLKNEYNNIVLKIKSLFEKFVK